ncbi:unnamed protein product, partial [Owenia fusiformis]
CVYEPVSGENFESTLGRSQEYALGNQPHQSMQPGGPKLELQGTNSDPSMCTTGVYGEALEQQRYMTIREIPEPIDIQETSMCNKCFKDFPNDRCLEYHTSVVHNLYCDVCQLRLDDEPNVQEHGLKHTGEKPHQCKYCYKLFNSHSGYFHHGKLDLLCVVCKKKIQRSMKQSHMKQHHLAKF